MLATTPRSLCFVSKLWLCQVQVTQTKEYLTGCNRSLFIHFLLLPLTRQHFSVLKLKTFITKSVDRKWSKLYYLIRLSSFIKLSSVERALRPTRILPGML